MKSIAIVEAISSGQMYIEDIIARGYHPIYVVTKAISGDPFVISYRERCARNFGNKAEFIEETENLDDLVEQLRERNTVLCLPGSEYGVPLADKITTRMGLPGNDCKTTYLRASKAGMVEALSKAGIRHIRTEVIRDKSDIARFWKENDLDKCVVKFSESAGTVGVKICDSVEIAEEHYEHLLTMPNTLHTDNRTILIQEFIGGKEYIVNTLSCNGRHMMTDIWVYEKVFQSDGTIAYDYAKLIKCLEPGNTETINYAYKVLDAVEMRWGACHIEIKVDKKGPVLIETNARPMGLAMTAAFLDECLGYHPTAVTLDFMLSPEQFEHLLTKPYNPPKYSLMKLMIVPENIEADFEPTMVFAKALKSTREILFFGKKGISEYPRTVDLDTSPLAIKMINEDYGQLRRDYELLRTIEENYFDIYYSSLEDRIPACERITDRDKLKKGLNPMWRYMYVDDDELKIIQFGETKDLDNWDLVDGVIFGKCSESKFVDRVRDMVNALSFVRTGGHCMILPESYKGFRNGIATAEFLLRCGGFELLAPTYFNAGILIGHKQ